MTPGVVERAADYGHKGPGFESRPHQISFHETRLRHGTLASSVTLAAQGARFKGLTLLRLSLLEFLSYA